VQPSAGAAPARGAPLAAFAATFAVALLAHQLWWRGLPGADLHGLVAALALWVLARPAAPLRLAALAIAEVVAVAGDLPTIGDHTLLAAVTALAFASAFAVAAARRRGVPAAEELWLRLAPFLRVQAVLLYGAAALAKLNSGFLDPAVSCAGPLAAELAFFDPSLLDGRWHVGPAIATTIAAEAALAVLLAVPRTRAAAVVGGAAFHAALALAGNVPFAAYALVLYVAFLPAGALPAWRVPARVSLPVLGALLVAGALADEAAVRDALRLALRLLTAAGLLAFAVRTGLGALSTRGKAPDPRAAAGRILALGPVYAAAAALLVLNALSPYAGLKTEASFAMFSNLQTEPGHWNHVLVPEAVRVFGAQDELVRLESTTAPALERRRRAGILMVRAELERFLRDNPAAQATFADARDRSRRTTASAATLGPAPLRDLVMNFYDVRPGARGRC
jgi:hypothetical protein